METKIILCILTLFLVLGCNERENPRVGEKAEKMTLETFRASGELHNLFMENVRDNFVTPAQDMNLEQKIAFVTSFHLDFLHTLPLTPTDKELMGICLEQFEEFVHRPLAYERIFTAPTRSDGDFKEMNIYQALDYAKELDVIDSFEHQNLLRIADLARDVLEEKPVTEELVTELVFEIIKEWEAQGYLVTQDYGVLLGEVLAISKASIDFWEANPDLPEIDGLMVPAWLALDIAGALVGAVSGGVGSVVTTGKFSWSSVGWGAGSCAVIGSTGTVGRIAKWFM